MSALFASNEAPLTDKLVPAKALAILTGIGYMENKAPPFANPLPLIPAELFLNTACDILLPEEISATAPASK